ncbi:unnamed protein product [Chironomus riparius]|uniref:ARID domain-containing protein n=1 Tax=Chironomus riparius TaxID=315576 RepID=A0A9P0IXR9_9DIPT|nr:unnamed protein product [Chironomus riparius]
MMQGIPQKDKDDPVVLPVGAQVSAKYKGAFCEAKVHTVVKNIKVKVAYKKGGTSTVSDDQIIGEVRVGCIVEIKDGDKKDNFEATITKIQDCSQYTVVFDDGDIATLRRTALCRQSGKHFNACDTLDQLPLTHPEHRGGGKRTKTQDEYESDDEEYAIGKVVCVENTDTKKKNAKESYFPALVVAPKAQENVKIHIKTQYLVRSFKDGRYYTVPKKEVTEFTNDTAQKSDHVAVSAAREFLDKNVLPTHWDREVLIDSASLSEQELSDSSDDEPNEVKDRFFAQLLEFMEKRNSPLNKGPSITNRDVDLYRLYYSVEKLGGYANVTKIRNWKAIAKRLGFTPTDAIVKLVKHSYRKFLLAFEEAVSKGIEELPPRINREKARSSSTRSGSVASPKVVENVKQLKKIEKPTTSSAADDSENTSESTKVSTSRKLSTTSTKSKATSEKAEEVIKINPKEKEIKINPKEKEKDDKEIVKEVIKEVIKEVEIEIKEKEIIKEIIVKEKEKSLSISSKDDEISPAATPSSKKKEPKKKLPEPKKKKEETIEKKEIVAAKPQVASGPSIAENVPIEIDDRLKVYYRGSSDYEAKVLDIQHQDGKTLYKVHYKGWNARYDEWIQRESIAENLTKEEGGKKKQSSNNNTKDNNNPKTPSTSSTNLQTPTSKNASKRARNRADTTASSRSTTPLSNTSSKTKVAQKRPIRGTPTSKSSTKGSIIDDNSSESDEPIKKPVDKKDKGDDKNSSIQKSSSDSTVTESAGKEGKGKENKQNDKTQPDTSKSDDEKSTKSSIKSGKSPFEAKGKLKTVQRDSSRSSFHSTDSDSSHSVPSDVPNSSKSAYTSENESNDPEKIPLSNPVNVPKIDIKKTFKFDEDANEAKPVQPTTSFFEKVTEKQPVESKPVEISTIFPTKKPNIFQEKKLAQRAAAAASQIPESAPPTTPGKIGRFSQLEKTLTKDIGIKTKAKEVKVEDKSSADSDIYEFKDTEEVVPKSTVVKKQESPNEGPAKKQQLAQQRKQARQNLQQQQKEVQVENAMEDIESMIKTSIVSFPQSKKAKKSPIKEEKQPSQSMIVARTTSAQPTTSQNVIVQSAWSSITNPQEIFPKMNVVQNPQLIQSQTPIQVQVPSRQPVIKSESTFDVLRKSPSFNMHLMDDLPSPPKIIQYPISSPSTILPSTSVITASPIATRTSILQGPLKFSSEIDSRDLLKPIMLPSKEDEKPEVGALMKILDQPYEIPPKAEKSTSIADKLLKAINQKESSEKENPTVDMIKKEEFHPVVKIEERKSDPYLYKAKSPASSVGKQYPISTTSSSSALNTSKKPLLISTESKSEEKIPIKGNTELQGIIEKLESAISTPAITLLETACNPQLSIVKKSNDDSDTDSDRLVIEDETAPTESTEKKKSQMGVLESIMMQDDVPYKTLSSQNVKESEKKIDSSSQEQQPSETMSLLLCEETIPGSPAPKDPLSEIGRSPTSSSSGGFVHPPSMPQSGYSIKYPGTMTTALLHQQYQATAANTHQTNLKQIPMDIDTDSIEAATGDILRDKLKSERGSATSSGNNTNNNSDNSNDDQSESEKNTKPDTTPRKKRRSLKTEPESQQKRRRQQTRTQTNVRGNLQGNDSDSNDNSDVNLFTTRSHVESGTNKNQFHFLVELDPNMPTAQRINVLEKKIQDLRKAYLLIKNEMSAKERRRKKMRKRERENKQKASKTAA